ncbi:MAG: hypothetical protein KIT87_03890 [Anaerolineae bacterium]|nr:hypothetical protein [Anaerolineae bacterium]
MRTHSDPVDPDERNESLSDAERDTTRARVTLRAALARYARAQNAAEAQLAVLAMHEGLRQGLRAWLLYQAHLTDRQREAIQDPYTRFGELLDLAVHHTRLFEGRRALWHDELNVLLDHRNTIAHPVEEMDGDTALAAATGWADLLRRFWQPLFGDEPPDLRHPDPKLITAHPKPAPPASLRPTLSFYADPTRPVLSTPAPSQRGSRLIRRIAITATIYLIILALFAALGLYVLSQLAPVLARF